MNPRQQAIEDQRLEVHKVSARVESCLLELSAARRQLSELEIERTAEREELIVAGIEGRNAEERNARLNTALQEWDQKILPAQRAVEAARLELQITEMWSEVQRLDLQARIAIAQSRD